MLQVYCVGSLFRGPQGGLLHGKHHTYKEGMLKASKPWITPDIKAPLKEKKRVFKLENREGAEDCAKGSEKEDQRGEEHLQMETGASGAGQQHQWSLEGPKKLFTRRTTTSRMGTRSG